MDRQAYTDRVLSCARRLTAREREAVRAEIDGHIEDHLEGLLELGWDEKLAEERTLASMGDPEEVGREIDKQYPLGWLIVSRIAGALIALLAIILVLTPPDVDAVWNNIRSRTEPEQAYCGYSYASNHGAHIYTQDLDIRVEIGSDVLYIYRVGVMDLEWDDRARVTVWACNYDRSWFGTPSSKLLNDLEYTTETLEHAEGLTENERYRDYLNIRAAREDHYIVARYDRNGCDVWVEIPLDWEEWDANETP